MWLPLRFGIRSIAKRQAPSSCLRPLPYTLLFALRCASEINPAFVISPSA
jgi:hypothetical protein